MERVQAHIPSFQPLPVERLAATILCSHEVRYVQQATAGGNQKRIDTKLMDMALRAGSSSRPDTMLLYGRPFIMPNPDPAEVKPQLAFGLEPATENNGEPHKTARNYARGVLLNIISRETSLSVGAVQRDTTLGRSEVILPLGTLESAACLEH
ncbi:MAG TPA: hypothetical protein VLE74_03970, partial [Candidatus Saccharimonadales bacterium]|nr:hypothetical protein [Candidatus Saccharimonadales bacterium]